MTAVVPPLGRSLAHQGMTKIELEARLCSDGLGRWRPVVQAWPIARGLPAALKQSLLGIWALDNDDREIGSAWAEFHADSEQRNEMNGR